MIVEYITQIPQVGAAVVTAACGILGVLINIIINIYFRNQDYKNKNRINMIEHIESYYMPLNNLISNLIETTKAINIDENFNVNSVLDGKMGAEYDCDVKLFKDSVTQLYQFFSENEYRFLNDYRLFKCYQVVKNEIEYLNQYICKKSVMNKELCFFQLLKELECLNYRIKINEVKTLIWNPFCKIYEYYVIWKGYYKKKK